MGFVITKTLKINMDDISKLLIYLITPMVAFFAGYNIELSSLVLFSPAIFFVLFFIVQYSAFYIISIFVKDKRRRILSFLTVEKNTGYLGLPVAMFLFDENIVFMYMITIVGGVIAESSIGIYMISRGNYSFKQSVLKLLKIPIIYAVILGLFLNFANATLPDMVLSYEDYFKYTYSFLGMFIIGIGLAGIKSIKFGKLFLIIPILGSFVLWPCITLGIIYLDDIFYNFITNDLEKVFLLASIMPIAANVIPFANLFGYDTEKVSFVLVISTLLALIYIPFIIYLLGLM
ncbi:MAG: Transporter [uncultured Campylobacterales bacterium]|uniref:Transporter n=1 Tax=uncultured Campylobacterales bacterium TaxID=352960 RepID=A0A6S6S060_9BACT|nr:MAG: Transporter [uncultured Campylobacterales bacterium]